MEEKIKKEKEVNKALIAESDEQISELKEQLREKERQIQELKHSITKLKKGKEDVETERNILQEKLEKQKEQTKTVICNCNPNEKDNKSDLEKNKIGEEENNTNGMEEEVNQENEIYTTNSSLSYDFNQSIISRPMNMMNYHLNFAKELELEMTPNSTYNRTGLELELPENENKNKDHTNAQCEETLKKNIENEKKILDMEEEIKQIHKRITKIEEKVNENTEETQTNRKNEQKSNTILAKNNNNDGNSNSGNKNKTESPKKNNDGIKNTTERKTLNNNKKLKCYLIGDSHLRYIENEIKKDPEWTEKFNVKINFIPGYRLQDIADNLIPQSLKKEDILVISGGTNDLYNTATDEIKRQIDKIGKLGCTTYIISIPPQDCEYRNRDITRLNTVIKYQCEHYKNMYVINTHKFIHPHHLAQDGIHIGRKAKKWLSLKITKTVEKGSTNQFNKEKYLETHKKQIRHENQNKEIKTPREINLGPPQNVWRSYESNNKNTNKIQNPRKGKITKKNLQEVKTRTNKQKATTKNVNIETEKLTEIKNHQASNKKTPNTQNEPTTYDIIDGTEHKIQQTDHNGKTDEQKPAEIQHISSLHQCLQPEPNHQYCNMGRIQLVPNPNMTYWNQWQNNGHHFFPPYQTYIPPGIQGQIYYVKN